MTGLHIYLYMYASNLHTDKYARYLSGIHLNFKGRVPLTEVESGS